MITIAKIRKNLGGYYMRKGIASLLTCSMVMAMTSTVYASEGSSNVGTGDQTIDVSAKYSDNTESPIVYNVELTWEAMEFTYAVGGTNVWNPDTHEYESDVSANWIANGNKLTLTNHSNAEVNASLQFNADEMYNSVKGNFDNSEVVLPSAENKTVDASELTSTSALSLSGSLNSDVTELTKVGTITVIIK